MILERHLTVPRTARYFVLGERAPAPPEVWIICHGYAQLAAPFLKRFELLDDGHRLVVAPEALSRFYLDGVRHGPGGKVGASWMTREDRLSEIDDYLGYLDRLLDAVAPRPEAGAVRVTALGFSQGTATASRWAVRGPARVDRLVLWAGLLPPEVDPVTDRARLNALDLVLVAGDRDEFVTRGRLAEQQAALDQAGVRHRVITFDGGHEIDGEALTRLVSL
jgi:predicted esterase